MTLYFLIYVILLIAVLVIIISNYKALSETFLGQNEQNQDNEQFLAANKKVKNGPKILDDKLFSDVVTYDNDPDAEGRLGIDKCLEGCPGRCLEFGNSGIAHCFPRYKPTENLYTATRNWENESDEFDRSANKLVYPAIR